MKHAVYIFITCYIAVFFLTSSLKNAHLYKQYFVSLHTLNFGYAKDFLNYILLFGFNVVDIRVLTI